MKEQGPISIRCKSLKLQRSWSQRKIKQEKFREKAFRRIYQNADHFGRFTFNPKFRKFRLVHHMEQTISVWSSRNIRDQLWRWSSLTGRSYRNVPFHLTKLLSPAYKNNNQTRGGLGRVCVAGMYLQGGKTFCAIFCASLIAGSRRAFLCVYCVCLFVAGVLSEMHEVPKFAPCKAFLFDMFALFRRLKITLDSEKPMLKEKWIIPSVWGGMKGCEHF